MKQYEVLISFKAQEDMEGIYSYIADELFEPAIATNQYDRIADAILTLEIMPERVRLMDTEPERSKGLRQLLVDNYSVFFVIHAETVRIARVMYSASDIQMRLAEE